MKIPFKHILFLLLLISLNTLVEANNEAPPDSIEAWDNSVVDYRYPTTDTIKYYKQLDEYNYQEANEKESILLQLWNWFISMLVAEGYMTWIGWLLLVLAILALLAIVIRLFGIPVKGLFVFSRSTKVTELAFSTGNADIENDNLEKALKNYIEGGAYREATRILFLMALRTLNRAKLIKWNTWKTDREYYYEIENTKLKADFLSVMRQYEYVWYGKFNPENEYFQQLNQAFQQLDKKIEALTHN